MAEYRCPTCKTALTERGDFFPFCSERCKLVELGAWMSGKYAIPGDPVDPEELADAEAKAARGKSGTGEKEDAS